jgi:hypothetical protein
VSRQAVGCGREWSGGVNERMRGNLTKDQYERIQRKAKRMLRRKKKKR